MINPPIDPPEDESIRFHPPYDYTDLDHDDIKELEWSIDPLEPHELEDPLLAAEMIDCGEIVSFDNGLTFYLASDVEDWMREVEQERLNDRCYGMSSRNEEE